MSTPDLLTAYEIQGYSSPDANTDISGGTFPTSGIFTGQGCYRISICADTAVVLKLRATPTGGSATNFPLLNNVALTVNSPFTFIVKVPDKMAFTFRTSASCVVQWMTVECVVGGII